ncbi:MAG: hypothetical protein O3A80_04945, partial [bacterium]|nr:hypothetical protein [bacterium]
MSAFTVPLRAFVLLILLGGAMTFSLYSGDVPLLGTIHNITGLCGDGNTDSGEECDDGNFDSSDGCSSSCLKECWVCWGGSAASCH